MYFALLDFLRFFAAASVMFYHYFSASTPLGSSLMSYYLNYGCLGVELFFIISGFVIHFSLRRPTKEYALGRFMRLVPLFWVICTFTYVMTLIFDLHHLSLKYYLLNLLVINNDATAHMVDGVYWTLTMEIVFYVLIGTFVWLFSTKRLEWFYALWLIFAFAVFLFGWQDMNITKIFLARYVPYFVFGGMFGLIYEKWKTAHLFEKIRHTSILIGAALLPLFISSVLIADYTHHTNLFGEFDQYSVWMVQSFFVLVPFAIFFSRYVTSPRWLSWAKAAGGITYPLYLLHQRVGEIITNWIGTYGVLNAASIAVAIGMVVVCYFVYRYEEKWRKAAMKRVLHLRYFARSSAPVASDAP